MDKRPIALVVIGFALLAIVILGIRWLWAPLTPTKLRAGIARELPLGSSSDQVLAFLDARQVSHSGPEVSTAETGFPPGPAQFVLASVRDWRKGNPLAQGVFLRFRFDDSLRLTHYEVEYAYTF
jgi:hypothetical protein